MKYVIVYDSKTGNTQLLAEKLYLFLKREEAGYSSTEIMPIEEFNRNPVEADIYFVGFWTDRGSCSLSVIDALEYMDKKKVLLFGTCGMGNSPQYYKRIESKVSVWIPDECEKIGFFLCQGKMPEQIKEKYKSMEGNIPEEQRQEILQQYEIGKSHPDDEDINNFIESVKSVLKEYRYFSD